MRLIVAVGLLLAAGTGAAARAPLAMRGCAAITPWLAAGQACADAPHGIVIAATPARAATLADLAAQGERRFVQWVGRAPNRYAVVEMVSARIDRPLDAVLARAGYDWRLPWLSEAAMADGYRGSIARAVRARADTMRLDPASTARLVQSALTQQAALFDPGTLRAKEAGALPHELGHGWLTTGFWPGGAAAANDHYGGPAPDWLDETVAILMEDDRLADRRRAQFAALYRGPADGRRALIDLAPFLSGGHPALPALDLPVGAEGVRVLTGAEAAGVAAVAGRFYLQARLFADYVRDRSGQDAVFGRIAARLARGGDTAAWLAADGPSLRLPATLPALQQDWEDWIARRLAGAATAAAR